MPVQLKNVSCYQKKRQAKLLNISFTRNQGLVWPVAHNQINNTEYNRKKEHFEIELKFNFNGKFYINKSRPVKNQKKRLEHISRFIIFVNVRI